MAVTLSKTQYRRLKMLAIQLQALIVEISQKGKIVDEVIDILQNIEVDTEKQEAITDTHVIKTKLDIKNINVERIKTIQGQLAEIRDKANLEGFDLTIEQQKKLIIKNFFEIKGLFFKQPENIYFKKDIEIFEAVEVNGMPLKIASEKFDISENCANYAVNRARVKLVVFLLNSPEVRLYAS